MELNFLGPIPGMKFVWIPPGEFWMGGPDAEPGWYEDESPRHWVRLTRGYYMMTTPVTQGQWEAVTGENPSKFNEVGPSAPVEKVSWYDVHVYIDKLNFRTESYRFRLPTETEWEYACRAGTETAFCNGPITEHTGRDPNLDKVGWYRENSGGSTHPVGQKEPNAWGLYDMHGNVWEWCNDRYGSYHEGPVTDPTGPGNGEFRVYRGGAWDSFLGDCRSAYRNGYKPDCTIGHLGFRLVAERRQDC